MLLIPDFTNSWSESAIAGSPLISNCGILEFVVSSVLEIPESKSAIRSGACVATKGVVSILKDNDGEGPDRFPAISFDFTVATYAPSSEMSPLKPTVETPAFSFSESVSLN